MASTHTLQKNICVAVYDLPSVLRFFGSVAMAHAIEAHTRLIWVDYKDSAVLNTVYKIFFWKGGPGFVEINQDWNVIQQRRNELWSRYTLAFLEKAKTSPDAAASYLETMEKLRDTSLVNVRGLFAEAQKINSEIIGQTTDTIKTLAAVKCGATITLTVLSGGLAVTAGGAIALQAGGVTLGYKVVGAVAKNLAEAKGAQAIGIDVGKEVIEDKAVQPGAEYATRLLASRPAVVEAAMKMGLFPAAKGAIDELSRQLGNSRTVARVGKLTARIASRQTGVATALAGTAGKAVPIVFAVKDVLGAIDEYSTDTANLR